MLPTSCRALEALGCMWSRGWRPDTVGMAKMQSCTPARRSKGAWHALCGQWRWRAKPILTYSRGTRHLGGVLYAGPAKRSKWETIVGERTCKNYLLRAAEMRKAAKK